MGLSIAVVVPTNKLRITIIINFGSFGQTQVVYYGYPRLSKVQISIW